MLQEDLEKRLEEIEAKIEELEDMILDNKLKIMNIFSKLEKKGPPVVRFDTKKEEKFKQPDKSHLPSLMPKAEKNKTHKAFFKPKKTEMKTEPENIEDLKIRAKKIKDMLRELK